MENVKWKMGNVRRQKAESIRGDGKWLMEDGKCELEKVRNDFVTGEIEKGTNYFFAVD